MKKMSSKVKKLQNKIKQKIVKTKQNKTNIAVIIKRYNYNGG